MLSESGGQHNFYRLSSKYSPRKEHDGARERKAQDGGSPLREDGPLGAAA